MRTTPFRPEIKQNLLPPIRRVSTSPTQLRKEFFPPIGFTRGFGDLDELVNDYPFDLAAMLGAAPAP